jgi:hypothetical protein
MIKVRIKRSISEDMLQEAMRVEDMGLPALIVTFIKEDLPKSREAQVRLANILKETTFPMILIDALGTTFGNWQRKLADAWEKTDTADTDVNLDDLTDRTTKLFQFLYSDVEKGRRYQMDKEYAGVNYTEDSMKAIDLKAIKGMRKALTKNLTKYGWHPSAAKAMNLFLDEILIRYYDSFIRDDYKGQQLIAFLKEHPDNQKDIADMSLKDALKFVVNYFHEKEDEERIIKRYPKKNMFWYSIGQGSCSLEARRMGHCGDSDQDSAILYSLRRKSPGMKVSDSHVTISYVEEEDAVYQIKGKGNCTPEERYGPYIVDFLKMMGVRRVHETGQHSDCDFDEFLQYLGEKYPEADYEASESRQLEELDGEIYNGDFNSEHVQIYSNFENFEDDPYMMVSANVHFRVPLGFLVDETIKKRFSEHLDDEQDEIKEEILEIIDFDYFNADNYASSFDINHYPTDDYITVNFDILDEESGGYAQSRQEAESLIDNYKYAYEESDVERYAEAIEEVLTAKFASLLNPETSEKMQDILDKIDELDEGYNYFSVYDEDREIYFRTYGIPLPIKVPQYPLPQGLNRRSNAGKYDEWENLSMKYQMELASHRYDMKQDFTTAVKRFHNNAVNAASKQLSLAMAGMDIEVEKPEELSIPKFVEITIQSPQEHEINGTRQLKNQEYVKPVYRIQITLMVEVTDDVSDIAWGMEYVDYLDKNMNNILNVFAKSPEVQKIQREINKVHADLVRKIKGGLDENRRRIKVRIS